MLLVAREEEENLHLERGAAASLVERVEKRVLDVLEQLHALEAGGQPIDQRRLADSDRALDRDVACGQRGVSHGGLMIA